MNIEEVRNSFQVWYSDKYVIRHGARGRSSRHLEVYQGTYTSDHARECWETWCAAVGVEC